MAAPIRAASVMRWRGDRRSESNAPG